MLGIKAQTRRRSAIFKRDAWVGCLKLCLFMARPFPHPVIVPRGSDPAKFKAKWPDDWMGRGAARRLRQYKGWTRSDDFWLQTVGLGLSQDQINGVVRSHDEQLERELVRWGLDARSLWQKLVRKYEKRRGF